MTEQETKQIRKFIKIKKKYDSNHKKTLEVAKNFINEIKKIKPDFFPGHPGEIILGKDKLIVTSGWGCQECYTTIKWEYIIAYFPEEIVKLKLYKQECY